MATFVETLPQVVDTIKTRMDACKTEEATKMSLIAPMLQAWGYDLFNPLEVVPEYTADVGTKQKEKVDYAIMKDGEPIILIECKPKGMNLDKHGSQLFRYFAVCPAKIGILTNGTEYRFFSDTEAENRMDLAPFLTIDLLNLKPGQDVQLSKFCRDQFDLEDLLPSIEGLARKRRISEAVRKSFTDPDEDFIRYFIDRAYDGKIVTKKVITEWTPLVKDAIKGYFNETVNARLQSAISGMPEEAEDAPDTGIVTTEEEIAAHNIVIAICSEVCPPERVVLKDAKSYCSVFLDKNVRKPIARFHFNTQQWYLSTFEDGEEHKVPIERVTDIYQFKEKILASVKQWL